MFDNLRNMAGLAGLLKDLPKIRQRMDDVRRNLGDETVTGESGGGAVRVVSTGLLRIESVRVEPALVAGLVGADQREPAEQLIAEAVNDALARARQLAEAHMTRAAAELGVPLPPGGLGGLL